jgi:hypothetical protein
MNGIPVPRLFKYVKPKTGITILEDKTLQWSTPDSFNDPFEFKNPFAYGFEWDQLLEVALQEYAKILTQAEEPAFDDGNPVVPNIKERRKECAGRETAAQDEASWREWKKTYLVLCLSAVHDHILMWSHYAQGSHGSRSRISANNPVA